MDTSWMYEKSRRKKHSSVSGPKSIKKIYYVAGGIISFLFISAALFVFYQSRTIKVVDTPSLADCEKTIDGFRDGQLEVIICVRDDGVLIVVWENLPEGTESIDIYRTNEGGGEWGLWRSIPVNGTSGGAEVGIEGPGDFEYSFKAKGDNGEALWLSENAPENQGRPLDSQQEGKTVSSGSDSGANSSDKTSNAQSGDTGPAPDSTPPPPADNATADTQSTNDSGGNDSPPPSSPPEEDGAYYTPDGQVISPDPIDLGDFWVQHVNKRIEIGWKNLPAETDRIVVDRSKTESGGYSQFLAVDNPHSSDFIRLVDNTIDEDHYYKMNALSGTSILEAYGPVFLPALK